MHKYQEQKKKQLKCVHITSKVPTQSETEKYLILKNRQLCTFNKLNLGCHGAMDHGLIFLCSKEYGTMDGTVVLSLNKNTSLTINN